jgi:hypothetical protein
MLREPKNTRHQSQSEGGKKPGRFQFVTLEQRIAPACHYNPQGKKVGCGHDDHHIVL